MLSISTLNKDFMSSQLFLLAVGMPRYKPLIGFGLWRGAKPILYYQRRSACVWRCWH